MKIMMSIVWFLLSTAYQKLTAMCIQLNLHVADLLFWYLSHHLTWHCSSISEDLHNFPRNMQHFSAKLFMLLFLNNFRQATCRNSNKKNFAVICCKIHANLRKSWQILNSIWCQMMAWLQKMWICLIFI